MDIPVLTQRGRGSHTDPMDIPWLKPCGCRCCRSPQILLPRAGFCGPPQALPLLPSFRNQRPI